MVTAPEQLVPGLKSTAYIYEPAHYLLAADAYKRVGPNVGHDGSNLTIAFLSLNRAGLSLRLLRSIEEHLPTFAGNVLVVDNGSAGSELDQLRSIETPYPKNIVELGHNHGVAGGRNRALPHIRTGWVLWLDNDIYFRANPLGAIQQALSVLGCHFLNLPLLDGDGQTVFAKGGHLYPGVDTGEIRIGGGSACPQVLKGSDSFPPFLSTFLFGGACVFNKATFEWLGCYDENMFIGFEDIDFSIRIFQQGLKIGNAGIFSLVHDHPPPGSEEDTDYERQRFARETLKQSASYLERKHGLRVWNASTEGWLRDHEQRLGIVPEPGLTEQDQSVAPAPASTAVVDKRPTVALLVDTDSWAFWNIAQQLRRRLADRFNFRLISTEPIGNVIQAFLLARDCDIVHVFWREYLAQLRFPYCRTYVEWLGGDYAEFLKDVVKGPTLSTAVYDHLWLEDDALRERLPIYRELVDAYYVGSRRLNEIYQRLPDYPDPLMVLEDGVDPELFHPVNLDRLDSVASREVVVGWTGNSNWASELGDFKGVHTILRPAVAELQAEGVPVRLELADRSESPAVPHDQMINHYARIDVYVCTSEIEGTPNPVLESMACGVPVISTDVGVVPNVFGPRQSEFILRERSVACLKQAIRRLVAHPSLFRELSEENLQSIRSWYWETKVEGFAVYFTKCLNLRSGSR